MSTQHEDFPPLTPEAERALREAESHLNLNKLGWRRPYLATFLRGATDQAQRSVFGTNIVAPGPTAGVLKELRAIADSLHSPPPAPPTREQMNEALQKLAMRPHPFSNPSTYYSLVQEHLKTLQQGIAYHCKE